VRPRQRYSATAGNTVPPNFTILVEARSEADSAFENMFAATVTFGLSLQSDKLWIEFGGHVSDFAAMFAGQHRL
jgi:hypothetical protein